MNERILTPSQLNREAAQQLRLLFGTLWLEGEVSNFSRAASGHWYFTLKDERAQVRCAMFRNRNLHCSIQPTNGMLVQIRAQVSLYEARGEFQLIAEQMREAGLGDLHRRYEALKRKLLAEGLFDHEHKRALPRFPRRIVVITSARGAALQDVCHTLARRWPALTLTVLDTLVQGPQAAPRIVQALQQADRLDADTLLLVRGGGSLEDLWAFNEEAVVRAVHQCRTPVIAAIGHETDTTLAELAADLRAATPTAAAEQAVPDRTALLQQLEQQHRRLHRLQQHRMQQASLHLDQLQHRLQQAHPARRVRQARERMGLYRQRLQQQMARRMHALQLRLQHGRQRLQAQHPALKLEQRRSRLQQARLRMRQAGASLLPPRQQAFATCLQKLDLLNPLHTLQRGYSITTDGQGRPIRSVHSLQPGQHIHTRLADGTVESRVEYRRADESKATED